MQRLDYANYVCSKVGQTDSNSVAICSSFVQQNYKIIYDAHSWRDSLKNVATNLTDTVNGLLQFPAGIQRILAIRDNGTHILVPIDSPMAFQVDPTVFERTGDPIVYEEFTDTTQNPPVQMLRFMPIPTQATPLLIVGKTPVDDLTSDQSTPKLRNVDQALIGFTLADMLERQRQYAKAQAVRQEAQAMLKEMIAVETEQGGYAPRVVPGNLISYEHDGLADWWLLPKGDYQ